MSGTGVLIVTTTLDDEAAARELAAAVVGERLAACAQVGGPLHSTYRWQGEVESATEWAVTMKTSSSAVERLVERVRSLHGYATPELVVTEVVGGDPDYLAWVLDETT